MAEKKGPSEMKPYVRYRLEAEVGDKGLGFSIRRALKAYLDSNGYAATVIAEHTSSDRFVATINFLDNGKYDFNMSALREHLRNSGRMPTNANAQPKISISPMPIEGYVVQKEEGGESDVSWQKTVKKLSDEVRDKEDLVKARNAEITNLTRSLSEKQRAYDSELSKRESLEKKLEGSTMALFNSPLTAVLQGYVVDSLDMLVELSYDWQGLVDNGDNLIFADARTDGRGMDKMTYLNKKFGLSFRNEAELRAWADEISRHNSWEETPLGKQLTTQKNQYNANLEVLKSAESFGASPEVVDMLRKAAAPEKADEISGNLIACRKDFDNEKRICGLLDGAGTKYDSFRKVQENSENRRAGNLDLPIVVHCEHLKEASPCSFSFYMPSIDIDNALDKQIVDGLRGNLSSKYDLSAKKYADGISEIRVMPKTLEQAKNTFEFDKGIFKSLSEATEFIRCLGVNPKIILLSEIKKSE
jgi:hypothetical protein